MSTVIFSFLEHIFVFLFPVLCPPHCSIQDSTLSPGNLSKKHESGQVTLLLKVKVGDSHYLCLMWVLLTSLSPCSHSYRIPCCSLKSSHYLLPTSIMPIFPGSLVTFGSIAPNVILKINSMQGFSRSKAMSLKGSCKTLLQRVEMVQSLGWLGYPVNGEFLKR